MTPRPSSHRAALILITLAIVSLGATSCERALTPEEAGERAEAERHQNIVARVNGAPISVAELQTSLSMQPPSVRDAIRGISGLRGYLRELIRRQLLLQEARRSGLDRDPDIETYSRQLLVEALWRDLDNALSLADISEADARTQYAADPSRYDTPARVELIPLFTRNPERARRLQLAWRLLTAGSLPAPLGEVFLSLARASSEGRQSAELTPALSLEDDARLPRAVIEAALIRARPGLLDAPITVEDGVYLVFVTAYHPREARGFDEVRRQARQALLDARRQARRDEHLEALRARAKIERLTPGAP